MRNINVNNLKLAELKYYNEEHNGIELTDALAYVILLRRGNEYVNIFKPEESYPVFERTAYSNSYHDEDFGTKVRLLTDEEDCISGPCFLLTATTFSDIFGEKVSTNRLEEYILDSELFFKDRIDIARKYLRNLERPFSMVKIICTDKEKISSIDSFFESRKVDEEKSKENRNW